MTIDEARRQRRAHHERTGHWTRMYVPTSREKWTTDVRWECMSNCEDLIEMEEPGE